MFFFNDTATTEIYTLSLHDALPIVAPATLARVSRSREELIDGLRAVTYLLHHLAPIFLLCDVRDLGSWLGDTTPAETGAVATRESTKARLMNAAEFNPTIYLYDSHAGGIALGEPEAPRLRVVPGDGGVGLRGGHGARFRRLARGRHRVGR